jgi:hypothetical protein
MSGTPDEYERRFMEAGETVRHRDKVLWRMGVPILGGFSLLALALGITGIVSALAQPAGIGMAIGLGAGVLVLGASAVLGFCAATLTVLRTVVTDRALHVQYGLWGPTIPLETIESVAVARYDWTRFGGWGLRGRGAERAFTIQGRDDTTLCVRWRDGATVATTWITVSDPAGTAIAIERARAARRGMPRVRIELDEDARDEGAAEAAAMPEARGRGTRRAAEK